jgi:hypothetical protein
MSQLGLHGVDDIARYLRGQDAEIVGQNNEDNAQQKAPAVSPEVLIYSL